MPYHTKLSILFINILLFASLLSLASALIINSSPVPLPGPYPSPVLQRFTVKKFANMTLLCKQFKLAIKNQDLTGYAALVGAESGRSPDSLIVEAYKRGAAAIINASPTWYAGASDYWTEGGIDLSFIDIPVVEIQKIPFARLVASTIGKANTTAYYIENPLPLNVTIVDNDPTGVPPIGGSIAFGVVITAISLFNIGMGSYKFYLHNKVHRGLVTTAKIFLIIDLTANIIRLWWGIVNPFYVNRFGFLLTTIFSSIHISMNIITTLLISLKWQELIRFTRMKVTLFLSKFKWPFIVIAILIFLLELISATLRGLWFEVTVLIGFSQISLFIITLIVVALLWHYGRKVLHQMTQLKESRQNSTQGMNLRKATIGLMASGGFLLLWCVQFIISFIGLFTPLAVIPGFLAAFVWIAFLALSLTSATQLISFPVPTGKDHTISTGNTTGTGGSSTINSKGANSAANGSSAVAANSSADLEKGKKDDDDEEEDDDNDDDNNEDDDDDEENGKNKESEKESSSKQESSNGKKSNKKKQESSSEEGDDDDDDEEDNS